ncbi:hypothetical protein C1I98_19770 [Spongiactinospora gelatinilytica]|uniref:Uncharacterized protein n=1 Tax=Spongiactinospora gelatinilytica TaxID=2666298 RepID=A0A2W2FY40_9ACTN|nr:hypothetical protein [Spongiactinospora gelatinilytica]PZG42466.1 hypothetical protein C1I98_19770 [Spongiactinospora gelatinilytica]
MSWLYWISGLLLGGALALAGIRPHGRSLGAGLLSTIVVLAFLAGAIFLTATPLGAYAAALGAWMASGDLIGALVGLVLAVSFGWLVIAVIYEVRKSARPDNFSYMAAVATPVVFLAMLGAINGEAETPHRDYVQTVRNIQMAVTHR